MIPAMILCLLTAVVVNTKCNLRFANAIRLSANEKSKKLTRVDEVEKKFKSNILTFLNEL
jgi:hypothetical protein